MLSLNKRIPIIYYTCFAMENFFGRLAFQIHFPVQIMLDRIEILYQFSRKKNVLRDPIQNILENTFFS